MKYSLIVFIGLILTSCTDVFETDLAKETLNLKTPINGAVINQSQVVFSWDTLVGADQYNLVIVSPCFDSMEVLVADSVTTKDRLVVYLPKGQFEWQLSANNNSSSVESEIRQLTIDSIGDFRNLLITLTAPRAIYSNAASLTFEWEVIDNAEQYRLEIRQGDWASAIVDTTIITVDNSIALRLNEESYSYGVQAIWQGEFTAFTTGSIVVDRTAPSVPVPVSPANGEEMNQATVEFNWTGDSDEEHIDSVYISGSTNFHPAETDKFLATNGASLSVEFPGSGTYYWKAISYDLSGNSSIFSVTNAFTITLSH